MARQKSSIRLPDPPASFRVPELAEKNTIGSKLSEARKKRGITAAELSSSLQRCGVTISPSGIAKWETGVNVPGGYALLAAAAVLDIPDMLQYFTGASAASELNAEGQRKLEEYRQDLAASGRYRPEPKAPAIRYITMPLARLSASAGTGSFLDEDNFDHIRVPETSVPAGAEFAVRISGDSMEPVYRDGQLVWVQSCSRLNPGEVGIFVCDGDGFIKSYSEQQPDDPEEYTDSYGVLHMQPVLISYNEKYPPRVIRSGSSFSIVGRVL